MEIYNKVINDLDGGRNSILVNLLMKLDGEVLGYSWGERKYLGGMRFIGRGVILFGY